MTPASTPSSGRRLDAARIAGAPISWGVSEVPGWGYQMTADRVLAEMSALGLAATEFGPAGFLADNPERRADQLRSYGLRAVGGFFLAVLHDPAADPLPAMDRFIDGCVGSGADVIVLAAHTGSDGYDGRPVLDEVGWKTMLGNLDRLDEHADTRGVVVALHPHAGTMVESAADVYRVLEGSTVGLCLDTGHLVVGGADPVAIARRAPERVRHVHLKDVDAAIAATVTAGEMSFGDAVRAGMFLPLGAGDVDIADLVDVLEKARYDGWYVLEQDVMLDAEPRDAGPAANVRESLDYLIDLERR
jgi:inosose dehydratase